jgi:hypothetical protein
MSLVQGSLVRFTSRFWSGGRPFSPKQVTATVEWAGRSETHPTKSHELGAYYLELVLEEMGTLVITFRAGTGEFSLTSYEVVAACGVQLPPVLDSARPAEIEEPPELPTVFDRASARRRLLAAGISVEDSWSDGKVQGALSGLEQVERQRRIHGR